MYQLLTQNFGFHPDNIRVLMDADGDCVDEDEYSAADEEWDEFEEDWSEEYEEEEDEEEYVALF